MQHTRLGSGGQKMMMSLMGGNSVENKSFADTLAAKMGMAAKAAQAEKYKSEANLNKQRFENMDVGRNQFMEGATGLSQPQLEILNAFKKSGQYQSQQRAEGPPTQTGEVPTMLQPTDVQPEWLTPEVSDKYNRARMTSGANMMGTGKSNAEQIMDALISGANLNRQDDMINGSLDPNRVAPAMAATAGKPTVDVTGSGIAFNPYGNTENLNTKPFIQNANIDAKAKVDAVLARSKADGGQLPAEAKMVEFYIGKGYTKDKAIEMARSKKNKSLNDIMLEEYSKTRKNIKLFNPDMTEDEIDRQAESNTLKAIDFLKRNGNVSGSQSDDPMGIR